MTEPDSTALADLEAQDIETAEEAGRYRHHPIVRWLGWASEISDQPQLAAVCGLTVLGGLWAGSGRVVGSGLRMLLAHGLATAAKSFIKDRVRRSRPKVVIEEGRYDREVGETHHPKERSFPSGHTAGAVAVATVVAVRHPRLAAPALALAAAASLVQLPRAKHYPSDLAAGSVIGLAGAGISIGLFKLARRAVGER